MSAVDEVVSLVEQSRQMALAIGSAAPMSRFCGFTVYVKGDRTIKQPKSINGSGVGAETPNDLLLAATDIETSPPPAECEFFGLYQQRLIVPEPGWCVTVFDLDWKNAKSNLDPRFAKLHAAAARRGLLQEVSLSGKGRHVICIAPIDDTLPRDIVLSEDQAVEIFGQPGSAGKSVLLSGSDISGEMIRLDCSVREFLAEVEIEVPLPETPKIPATREALPTIPAAPSSSIFRTVNDAALRNLDAWVPMMFPAAKRYEGRYRVQSTNLSRNLEEDLSIDHKGIIDFGVADQGDPKQGRRTAIDLVVEHQGLNPIDAASWLASRLRIPFDDRGWKPKQATQEPPEWTTDVPPPGGATEALRATHAATWPKPLDLVKLAGLEPQPPRFIINALLPSGYATLFAAHGGTGKSTIALYQAVCVALGLDFVGYECEPRRVLYLSCEDRERVLHWRLSRICRHLGFSMAELAGKLEIVDLVGHDSVLWITNPGSGASYTAAYGELAARIKASGSQVVYVDGIADVYGGEENSRAHVKQFVNALVGLIDPDDGAIVLIGHVNKVTASGPTTSEGYSGSTGWHNAVRARWYLYPEQEQDEDGRSVRSGRLLFELQKNNLGQADETTAWRWSEDTGMFLPEESRQSNFDRVTQQRDERRGILLAMRACANADIPVPAATTGRRTAFHVLSAQPDFADSMRSGKPSVRRFWREIEHLRAIKHIEDSSIRREDRHRVLTLALTTEGMRACGQ